MAEGQQKKILIAEDDLAMREIIFHKLSTNGFNVREAENGKVALEMVAAEKPDLLLLDLMMPEVDGFGVLESLRKNPDPEIAKLPVIVLSNLWSSNDVLKVRGFFVDDFMIKAYFTPDEILGKINVVLEKRSAQQ